jgi:hypothetical protein
MTTSRFLFNTYTLGFTNRLNYQRFSTDETIDLVWDIFAGNWD